MKQVVGGQSFTLLPPNASRHSSSTVAPVGIPHRLEQDDIITVNGETYDVPSGTTVIANVSAIHHDDRLFPEPHLFKPERYLHPDGSYNSEMPTAVFGFGRRICPGMHLAEGGLLCSRLYGRWMMMRRTASLFIVLATLVWAFDFEAEVDAKGEKIMPEMRAEKWSASAASCVRRFALTGEGEC